MSGAQWSAARVYDALMAMPKLGPVKVATLMRRCAIAQGKTVGGASERQRRELAAALEKALPYSTLRCHCGGPKAQNASECRRCHFAGRRAK